MDDALEERFEAMGEDAIQKAETLDCSIEDFYRGLKTLIGTLQNRLDMAAEEGVEL